MYTLCLVFLSNCLRLAHPGPQPDWADWLKLEKSGQLEDGLHRTQLRLFRQVQLFHQVGKLSNNSSFYTKQSVH